MRVDLLARLTEMAKWSGGVRFKYPPYACAVGVALLLSYEFSQGPLSPRMLPVGLAVNLLMTAVSVRTVVRLQKILR